jgi:anti-anti-sigma factor
MGQQAVIVLPEHIDGSNAGQVREELLAAINRGAATLIVDMTATVSCGQAVANVMMRAYQCAVANGTQLRLVVTAQVIRRVLSADGLDRLISIYPSLQAATAAPAAVIPPVPRPAKTKAGGRVPPRGARTRRPHPADGAPPGPGAAAIAPSLLWTLVDAFADGVALTDGDGALALVNRRLADMFGYPHTHLIGRPVESLIPSGLRVAHRRLRADYVQAPVARPMGARRPLVGLRKDRSTFPVAISLSPVPTATGRFTLAVIRDITQSREHHDLADLARAAVTAQAHHSQELLDTIASSLSNVGLSLQAAIDLPSDLARQRIAEAVQRLDDAIHQIRD